MVSYLGHNEPRTPEEQALIEVAESLGLRRDQLAALHATYLGSIAISARADGVVAEDETQQLVSVAGMPISSPVIRWSSRGPCPFPATSGRPSLSRSD